MKKYKKKLLLISVILSLIIVILLLTFYNSGDNFKPDSDHSFYKSEYMVYSDGMITIKNPNNYEFDIYKLGESKHSYKCKELSDISKYAAEAKGNYVIYDDQGLTIYDNGKKSEHLIANNYDISELGNNCVYYTKNNQIYCYNILNEDTCIINDVPYEDINSLVFADKYLLVYYNDNHFRKINIYDENNKLISDFKLHSDSLDFHDFDDVYIDLIKEQIIVYPGRGENTEVLFYTFNGEKYQNEYFNYYFNNTIRSVDRSVDHSCFQGKYVAYSLRESKANVIYDKTIRSQDNGLYIENLETGETKKLSEKCEFDDILVTDNYVYCYKINYFIPKSILYVKDLTVGYELTQIPIT